MRIYRVFIRAANGMALDQEIELTNEQVQGFLKQLAELEAQGLVSPGWYIAPVAKLTFGVGVVEEFIGNIIL